MSSMEMFSFLTHSECVLCAAGVCVCVFVANGDYGKCACFSKRSATTEPIEISVIRYSRIN